MQLLSPAVSASGTAYAWLDRRIGMLLVAEDRHGCSTQCVTNRAQRTLLFRPGIWNCCFGPPCILQIATMLVAVVLALIARAAGR
jgi:hypothetical protein